MAELRNYTPHRNLAFWPENGDPIPLPPIGNARATPISVPDGRVDALGGVPLEKMSYGAITGLPNPEPGVFLVVSMLIAQLCPEREDLGFPNDLVRDSEGTIVGFKSLGRMTRPSE